MLHHGHSSGSFTAEVCTTTHSDTADGYSGTLPANLWEGTRYKHMYVMYMYEITVHNPLETLTAQLMEHFRSSFPDCRIPVKMHVLEEAMGKKNVHSSGGARSRVHPCQV